MAISIYRQDKNLTYNIRKFVLDSPADLEFLTTNCAAGSSAFIISNSQLYMLNNNKEWKLIPKESTSGITISNIYIDENNHLICELSDGTIIDSGELPTNNITLINGGNANTIF